MPLIPAKIKNTQYNNVQPMESKYAAIDPNIIAQSIEYNLVCPILFLLKFNFSNQCPYYHQVYFLKQSLTYHQILIVCLFYTFFLNRYEL